VPSTTDEASATQASDDSALIPLGTRQGNIPCVSRKPKSSNPTKPKSQYVWFLPDLVPGAVAVTSADVTAHFAAIAGCTVDDMVLEAFEETFGYEQKRQEGLKATSTPFTELGLKLIPGPTGNSFTKKTAKKTTKNCKERLLTGMQILAGRVG
jgi:hypothetical protein